MNARPSRQSPSGALDGDDSAAPATPQAEQCPSATADLGSLDSTGDHGDREAPHDDHVKYEPL
jgi:hypothetical protein